ncbi:protein kinase, putative [Cordyceps militaris CM01]|uniref:Protein kinase, putative n=1 Tax=Cordyceps militaris (strain CM01) TaxID=983644 RepID=G3JBZ9_CORMM|nr:protein kinase, putative [Cordyceps militaris CM01]EGX93717.1 protein kinase, putative [Cordyceps militaris CM01]
MPLDSPPPFRYRQPLMPYVEDVEKYLPGGYHPVDLGDTICAGERAYQVIHKLGYGGLSTVWLVRSCARSPSYFALKVLRANLGDMKDGELRILQHLRAVAGAGHPNVVVLHDSFKVSGPNGEHHCLVFPVLGPSLDNVNIKITLPSTTRHKVCQQVASATTFLHHHGVCHGDLTLFNIVFELPDIQSLSPDRVFQLLGPIKTENMRPNRRQYTPHAPRQVVQAPDFSGLDFSSLTQIRIVDFGQAFFAQNPPRWLGVPIDFFPAELCFGHLPSMKSDVWQLACVLFQIHTKQLLFPTGFRIYEILISTITSYLGPIPQHWRGKFDFNDYGYHEPGQEQDTTDIEAWFEDKSSEKTMESRLVQKATHLSTRQRKYLVQLLSEMVAYEPAERLSAVDVMRRLESASFLDEDSRAPINDE